MEPEDIKVWARLLNELRELIDHRQRLGVANLPAEFSGVTSDMLFSEGTTNKALVLMVDGMIQESRNGSNEEIISRFKLVEGVMATIYERIGNS